MLKLTTDRHKTSRGPSAAAQLLISDTGEVFNHAYIANTKASTHVTVREWCQPQGDRKVIQGTVTAAATVVTMATVMLHHGNA